MPIVTAVGVSVNTLLGPEAQKIIEDAMHEEVNRCIADGLSPESDGEIIKGRMMAAHHALHTFLSRRA